MGALPEEYQQPLAPRIVRKRRTPISRKRSNITQKMNWNLKKGKGVLSNLAGNIPVFGAVLKYMLQKLGLGLVDCRKVMN